MATTGDSDRKKKKKSRMRMCSRGQGRDLVSSSVRLRAAFSAHRSKRNGEWVSTQRLLPERSGIHACALH